MIRLLSVAVTGPLERFAEGLAAYLSALHYTRLSARNVLYVFAHLSRWLAVQRLGVRELTARRVTVFLRARRRAGYTARLGPRTLDVALGYLRKVRALPDERRRGPLTTVERALLGFAEHLRDERALAPATIRQRIEIGARFLARRPGRSALRTIRARDVRSFLLTMRRTYPRSLGGVGSDLRSLLRYLFLAGLHDRDLSLAVPATIGWRHRSLPRGVSSSDVQRMLASCDRRTVVGKRDYAILLLLTRLGLRQCEVCALTLDDIDWARGVIAVRGKRKKVAELPLPKDVGAAISAYLLRRPRVESRGVFLRSRAPYRSLRVIGQPVFTASQRAGIAPVWPHRLRHTAATEMLRRGATLAEIGEVLRHASTRTTAIYAKVDRRALRELAQPWPAARS